MTVRGRGVGVSSPEKVEKIDGDLHGGIKIY